MYKTMRNKCRKEIEEALEELINNHPTWFCPLIAGICNADCICISKPHTHKVTEEYTYVYPYTCGNPMFFNK